MAVLVLGSVSAVLKLADPVAVGVILLGVTLVGYTKYVLDLINQVREGDRLLDLAWDIGEGDCSINGLLVTIAPVVGWEITSRCPVQV
jgi:hypothetical protein